VLHVLNYFMTVITVTHDLEICTIKKLYQKLALNRMQLYTVQGCLGGAEVRRRTRDRKVAGSTSGRGAIKSTRSSQPSIPRLRGR